jgi:hypothetical protein
VRSALAKIAVNHGKLITSQKFQNKFACFQKTPDICSARNFRHDNKYYKQALVVAQYQFLIRCYSAMFRNEI